MRIKPSRLLVFLVLITASYVPVYAQSFTFNCTKDTLVPRCSINPCFTLKANLPDIHIQSGSYTVNPIGETPNACFPVYVQPNDPAGTSANLLIDDFYSNVINIAFPFSFYGSTFSSLIASPNGVVSFDVSNAGQRTHYGILRDLLGLSATTGIPENLPSALYDRLLIMGPYHDMNPEENTSPGRRIQYQTIGVAPHRKWVLSFYKMPLYYNAGGCNALTENTHQIVLYESTGIIEVLVFSKQPCTAWNDGRAMIGIQNFGRNLATMVTGRRASDLPWGTPGMQEAYRFVPSGGASLFKRVELCDLAGNILATGTTSNLGNGKLQASFPNAICPAVGATITYVVRSVYSKFDNPAVEIYGTDTVNVTKSADPDLHATATITNTDCYTPTGSITINVPSGTAEPPYLYKLDANPAISSGSPYTLTNVGPGNHTVVVSDPSGTCISTINVLIEKNPSLVISPQTTPTACANVSTGTITVRATNGVAPYLFQLDGNAYVVSALPTYTFTNVSGGSHLINGIDAINCHSVIASVNVAAGAGVSGSLFNTPVATSCAEVANGSITAVATAGTAPFTWQLDAGPLVVGASPHTFTGVSSGSHVVTIRDAIGCEFTLPAVVAAGPGVNGTMNFTAASCQGINNGSIKATATAGAGPFTWSLDSNPFQPGTNPFTFNNVSGGLHTVVIKDNVGCATGFNVTVPSGPPLAATTNFTATSCNGASNGTITIMPTNGTGPYRFSLDGNAFVTGSIPFTFNNVSSGPHQIVYTDFPGCVSNAFPVNVLPGPGLTTTVAKTNVLCKGGATGTITITQPSLGTAPYQYSIDGVNWQPSNIFTGLTANTYTAFYRSANGCLGSQQVIVNEPSQLSAINSMVPVTCFGENNGMLTITTSGGIGPYQYSSNGGLNWQSSNVFTGAAGTYPIIVRDANLCTNTISPVITQPALLTATSNNLNASCDGGDDGKIIVNAVGGNLNYRYSIDGVNYQASNLFFVAPGLYTIKVKDEKGCTTSFNTTVGLTVNLFLTPLQDATICSGNSTQLHAVSNATIYTWEGPALTNTIIPNPTATPSDTSQYIVTATLGRCTTTDTMMVNVNKAPIPDAGPDGDICYGQSYTLQGSGGFEYTWTPALYLNTTTGANPIATPSKTTTYTLSVTDAIGCHSLVTDQVKVVTSRPMRINTYPFDTIAHPGAQIHLLATSAGIRYTWYPSTGLNNPNIADPIVTVGNIGDEIMYQVVGVTEEGCKGEGYVKIKVYKGPDIYVPTAFTPNNDGKNDVFMPFPVGIKSCNYFRVYNRWGQLMFSTSRLQQGWDGKLAGKEQPSGVYVWMAEVITIEGKIISKKGTTTLIR